MSCTLLGMQDLLDKTLADLEAQLGVGGLIRDHQRPLTTTISLILGFKVEQNPKIYFPFIILFSYSISLVRF